LCITPILLRGSMFYRLPVGQEVPQLEAFEQRCQTLVRSRGRGVRLD
jgi:hypothetical protein